MNTGFPKVEERWREEQEERARHSSKLRRLLLERGVPVLRSYGVRQAWLFGSVADGKATPSSDIDILATPVTAEAFWSLRRELEDVLGCPLDLYTERDDAIFVRKVKERGEIVYEAQS